MERRVAAAAPEPLARRAGAPGVGRAPGGRGCEAPPRDGLCGGARAGARAAGAAGALWQVAHAAGGAGAGAGRARARPRGVRRAAQGQAGGAGGACLLVHCLLLCDKVFSLSRGTRLADPCRAAHGQAQGAAGLCRARRR